MDYDLDVSNDISDLNLSELFSQVQRDMNPNSATSLSSVQRLTSVQEEEEKDEVVLITSE